MKPDRVTPNDDFGASDLSNLGALAAAGLLLTGAHGATLVPALCLAAAAIPFIYRGVAGGWPSRARTAFELGLALTRSARLWLATSIITSFEQVTPTVFDAVDTKTLERSVSLENSRPVC